MRGRLLLWVTFALTFAFAANANAARVGILSNNLAAQTAADFALKIPGHTFTGVDVSATVPSLDSLLANYDVVLLFEDTVFANATAVGNVVADFAKAGRAVVLGTFYDQDRSDATSGNITPHGWGALETLDPNTTDGFGASYSLRTLQSSTIAPHPLARGISSLFAAHGNPGPYAGGNQAKPGTRVVAVWAQKNALGQTDPAIDYRITGKACVIHIGIAPQYGVLTAFGVYGVDFGGDFYQAWKNAFDYGSQGCRASTIPTLSDLALALLAVMMTIASFAALRRRYPKI